MLSDTVSKLFRFAWLLPGFLLWAAYPPMGERTDVLFALAPLMWLSRRAPGAAVSAKRWFQSGCLYWLATLSWMPAIVKNGGPWPLVVLGWFALAAYCALYFAAYGWLSAAYWQWARRPRPGAAELPTSGRYGWRLAGVLLVEPLLWCGLELVRSRLFGGFAWNQLGVVPVNSGFGAPAALGGVYLCSAVVILINGTIAGIGERMWKPERSGFANLRRLGVLETVLAFALVFGIYRSSRPFVAAADSRPLLSVALVQRNFPCCFQPQEERPYEAYGRLLDNVAPLKPDLVVLAESALCEFGPVDQQGAENFARWVAGRTGAALLAGGTRYADGCTYNSAALYVPPSASLSVYDKVHLVPFGEFIPGDKLIPALQQFAPVGSCTPGELKTLALATAAERLELGVAICFEDTDSAQLRELARKGARVLCFLTNDSWFSRSVEAEQHAWQAVARAIETGLPVVRVGNSGVSGTIAPDGRATWLLGEDGRPLVDRPGTMFDRIPAGSGKTAYVVVGDAPLGIAFALLISSMILVKYRNSHEYGNQA
ncbi:MAG: apolipoprotein N-acyltransferase [Kiritimatiellia bacterium]